MPYNAVLINIYDDGTEHSGWHCDNDPWLGETFSVPSISFGGERDFCVRKKKAAAAAVAGDAARRAAGQASRDGDGRLEEGRSAAAAAADEDHDGSLVRVRLAHGSLCLMDGRFQHEYEHSVPTERGPVAVKPRVNLTWRHVLPGREKMHNPKPRWDSP